MKKLLLFLIQLPLWAGEFQKFDPLPLGAQAAAGALGAGIGYLFLKSSIEFDAGIPSAGLSAGQSLIGLSLGYTLGVLFSGKFFQGKGNPFITLAGNLLPFIGPLVAYHLTSGSNGFSESLALFNLNEKKLTLGLPIPYRKMAKPEQAANTVYYVNLVIIHL
jgi:hypothetical protein